MKFSKHTLTKTRRMKKIIFIISCLLAFSGFNSSYASSSVVTNVPAPVVYPEAWKNLKLSEFIKLTPKNYTDISGKKMTVKERIAFSVIKMKMKRAIKKDQNLTVSEFLAAPGKISTGILILLIVGIIAIIILIVALATAASSGWI